MELNDSIKSQLIESGQKINVEVIESLNQFYKNHYIRTLEIQKYDSRNLIGKNIIVFVQNNLFRFKSIVEGYVIGLNNNNPLCSVILLRTLYETTGALAFFHKKYEQYKGNSLPEEEFKIVLNKLFLGSKSQEVENAIEPYNVMKLIDATDYFLKKITGSNEKRFRLGYDRLSEISHPNNYGYFLGSEIKQDLSAVHFTDETKLFPLKYYYFEYFALITEIYKMIYKDIIKHREDLPYIVLKR
ncbi:hypothetical protein [Lysinibacillus capsici]|uniref:hypothetical protein n=1 Tax=Lysinibacillus capsici TaxID=2115968 RepID=UPI003BAA18DF